MRTFQSLLALFMAGLLAVTAHAGPGWHVNSFSVAPLDAPKVVAAIDEWFAASGKDYPGQVTLLFNEADGIDPATHTILQTYPSMAANEQFSQSLQADEKMAADWAKLLGAMSGIATPVQRAKGAFLRNWGDVDPNDTVWMHHFITTDDAPAVVAAIDRWMNSPTGKKAPGQMHLSGAVAGGLGSATHIVSIGYASQAEAEQWQDSLAGNSDFEAFMATMQGLTEYHGANLLIELKSWGNPPEAISGR
jgi:hypothetical protein